MDNLNTYIIDTLADTLGHEPTLGDVVALNVPDTIGDPRWTGVGPAAPYVHGLTSHADLTLTLASREAARRYRAAQA